MSVHKILICNSTLLFSDFISFQMIEGEKIVIVSTSTVEWIKIAMIFSIQGENSIKIRIKLIPG